jgi:membrane protease YdiL (CAAX protease family)
LKVITEKEKLVEQIPQLPFWLYFVAFTIAELLTALVEPIAGLICHGIILTILLVNTALLRNKHSQNFILSLILVPLVRIMSLSMPLAKLPQIYWYPLIYAPLLAAAIVVMQNVKLKPRDIGFTIKRLPWQIAGGIVFGMATGVLEWAVLRPQALVTEFTLEAVLAPAIIMFVTTGFVEEFIFRGVIQQTSKPVMGTMGLVYVSLTFAILHIGHLSALDIVLVFLIAICFAVMVKRTGSIVGVVFAHGTTNVFLYMVVPFLLT